MFVYNATQTGILGSGAGDGVQGRVNGGLNDPPGNHISRYDPTLNFLYPTEWDLPFCIHFSCRPKLLASLCGCTCMPVLDMGPHPSPPRHP